MPHVSVVIPVFNSSGLIGTAIHSVFAQTYRDFEVIVVDDGSDDREELAAALAPWRDRILTVRQSNGGPAKARNTGIARSSGQLVAFLDADDEWLPEKLAKQVEYFERYPETGLLHTAMAGEGSPGVEVPSAPQQAFCGLYHTEFFINTLTVMVPRRVLEAVGGFDERREIHIEDWDLWLRIAASYPIGYLQEPLAFHRPGGLMSSQLERTYEAQALVIEKNRHLCSRACSSHRQAPRECERARRHVLHRDWGYDRLASGDRAGAREQLRKALSHAPMQPRTAALYLATFLPNNWRARIRSLTGDRPHAGIPSATPTARPATRAQASPPSLVHDTLYRRTRRRVIARLHDLDDTVSRSSRAGRRVMFDAASPMSFAIFRPIYERLRRDPRLELWFTAHGRVWPPQEIFGPAGITRNVVEAATAKWMKVDLYINTDFWDMTWVHRRTRRVHLFHGVAGKYGLDAPVDLAPTIAAFDALLFANADRRRRYIEAGLVPDDEVKAALIGYPKVDCLVDGSLDRHQILRGLGLDPLIPTVIYAPTWSPYASLNVMGEEIIDRLAAAGFQVIVKLHDRSYDCRQRGAGGVDWAARLSRFERHRFVRVGRDADSCPFLAGSDVMVSDHSSIAFEYMLLDRPVVLLDCPELIRQAGINPEKVRRLRSGASVVQNAEQAARAVRAALHNPLELTFERRQIASDLFYRAGTATERAVALVYRLIDLPSMADASESAAPLRELSAAG